MRTHPGPASNLVDRAAQRALRDTEETSLPDLLVDGFDFIPTLWHIVIEPVKPRTHSSGGIEVVDSSQEAEAYQKTVGRVLKCGPLAFDGTTTSGQVLKKFALGIECGEDLVGKYVVHQSNIGQIYRLRETEQVIKVILLEQILGVVKDPDAWKFYI
jgi:hypothetical protein